MRHWHRCFPVNFAKFLRTSFLQYTSGDCFWILALHLPLHIRSTSDFNLVQVFNQDLLLPSLLKVTTVDPRFYEHGF